MFPNFCVCVGGGGCVCVYACVRTCVRACLCVYGGGGHVYVIYEDTNFYDMGMTQVLQGEGDL